MRNPILGFVNNASFDGLPKLSKVLLNQFFDNGLWLTDYLGGILHWNALLSKCSNDGVGDSEVDDDDVDDTNAEYRYD